MRSALFVLALTACGGNEHTTGPNPAFDGLVQISGASPFTAGCNSATQPGSVGDGLEVEPWVAVDPTNPKHLVAVWQQDRWSTGGANGNVAATSTDGGATWTTTIPGFTVCENGDHDRSTDPWVTITPDGTVFQSALVFNETDARSAMLVTRSTDGGASWEAPVVVLADNDPDVFNDKDSITADPTDAMFVYAVWDRLTGLTMPTMPIGTGPTMFARATAGVWGTARAIFDPGVDAQTIGNVIVVLPDGTLVDSFDLITNASSASPVSRATVIRSTDHGDTWSAPIDIAAMQSIGVSDTKHGVDVRTGDVLPQVAVDPVSGMLYVAWQDGAGGTRDAVVVTSSADGGLTWSTPQRISQVVTADAFGPTIAVTTAGEVGVLYYDDRDDDPTDTSEFLIRAWLVTSSDHGASWSEEPLCGAFDLQPSKLANEYFLGDYQGLGVSGDQLVPVFAAANTVADPTDIFVRPLD